MRIWISGFTDLGSDRGSTLGAPVHIRAQVRELRRAGHEVTAFLAAAPGACPEPGVIRVATARYPARRRFASEITAFQLGIVPAMLARAARQGAPDVLLARAHFGLVAPVALARSLRVPVVSEVNACLRYELSVQGHGARARAGVERLERWTYRHSRRVVAVSDGVAEHLVLELGVDPARVRVCPNGSDLAPAPPHAALRLRRRIGVREDEALIGYVGGLQPHQGVMPLLEAFGVLRERGARVRLLCVGAGPEEARLRERIAAAPWRDRVTLRPPVPRVELAACLAAMDVCVAPRFDPRPGCGPGGPGGPAGSPLKLFDYLAAGRPVVAGTLPDLRFIEKLGAGLCVDPRWPEELATALGRLVADPALRRRMGEAGRRWFQAHGHWSRAIARLESVLREAVAP